MYKSIMLLMCFVVFSKAIFASRECLQKSSKKYNYHFKAKVKHYVSSDHIKISNLPKTYYTVLVKDSNYKINSVQQQNQDYYRLEVAYTLVQDKRVLELSGPLVLRLEGGDLFYYEFSPDTLKDQRYPNYLKKTHDSVVVKEKSGSYEFVIEKEVTYRKPMLIPEFVFIAYVKKIIKNDMLKTLKFHLDVLETLK